MKQLSNGEWAVAELNTGDAPANLSLDMKELVFLTAQYYDVTNVWTGKADGQQINPHSELVDSHDVVLYRLKPGS